MAVVQQWTNTGAGGYKLYHIGCELEVKHVPKGKRTTRPGEPSRPYEFLIDGITVGTAWTISEAKTKAMKSAEHTHRGQPLPIAEPTSEQQEQSQTAEIANIQEETVSLQQIPQIDTRQTNARQTNGHAMPVPTHPTLDDGVHFHMTGTIAPDRLATAEAIATINAAVALLREHGEVICTLRVPNIIDI